jgi:prepilin-type N-terminal cleavage/methylation domain-containing protein
MMMSKSRGLTIFEVLVVMAILAIVSTFVVPGILNWRSAARFRGAVDNLRGDLEMAKARAVRENNIVTILFLTDKRYEIFVDNGAGGAIADDGSRDGEELLLLDRKLPVGVNLDLADTSFGALGCRTGFNGRGHCIAFGHTLLKNDKGDATQVTLSRLGQITQIKP